MSSQTTIDQYFKSSSSKKGIKCSEKSEKATNRSKFSLSRTRVNNGSRNGGKTPAAVKKNNCGWNAVDASWRAAVQAGERLTKSSISSVVVNAGSSDDKSLTKSKSPETPINAGGNVTPKKLTIKSFAKFCNTPPKDPSPVKISLKRRNNNVPVSHSPPKKTEISDENLVDNSHCEIIEIPVSSSNSLTPKSATLRDDFPDDFDPDIVELNVTNSCDASGKKSAEKLKNDNSLNWRVSPEKRKFAITDVKIENAESPNEKKNNSEDDCGASSPKERRIALKTGNTVNSAPKSPWKVAVTIETPDRSMTALSSDWQKTLEDPKKSSKLPSIEKNKNPRENFGPSTQSSKSNDENSPSENLPNSTINFSTIKRESNASESSPRRALFSPRNTPKKVHFESQSSAANFLTSNGEPGIGILTNGNNNSSIGILRAVNLPINGQSNSTKSNDPPNSPAKINGISRTSPQKDRSINSFESPKKTAGPFDSPIKSSIAEASSSSRSNGVSPSPAKPIGPPVTPTKTSRSSFSPRVKNSPRKARQDFVDTDIVRRVVENLNQAKQGVIPPNDFDLETIYAKKSFDFEYGILNTNTAIKFETKDVRVPEDKHSNHFFIVLDNVFSEPLNCGYFDEPELGTVFSMMTLSPEAQSLLARILKRKRGWHRVNGIQYPELRSDLTSIFTELVAQGFLDGDIENEEISVLLNLLKSDEVKNVCQAMKINHKGTKPKLIADLVTLSNKKCSLFPGAKSPSAALKDKVAWSLGPCIRVPQRIESLINRIFILFFPSQDPKETIIGDALHMLLQVQKTEKIFPPTPRERFPIFRDRSHLIRYADARDVWNRVIKANEKKKWDKVRELGTLAYERLMPYFESNDGGDDDPMSTLPSHVKRFDDNYVWTKILWNSVDAFKKEKNSGIDTAAKFLEVLTSPRNKIPGNRIRWYTELALIEMYHRKNLEKSAEITIEALNRERLSEIDAAEILERARKLLNRSKGITLKTKERIRQAVELKQQIFISTTDPVINEIEATMLQGNVTGAKSTWSVEMSSGVGYTSVEEVALLHYHAKGFNKGLHCEGALPVTLFAVLFWRQIYEISVPGAFVSLYQHEPLDLYNSSFLESRRECIENQMKVIRNWRYENLSQSMRDDLIKYRNYESLIHRNLFSDADEFKECIECLGINAVIGICELLAGNFNQWKSGFPDLIVWNSTTKKCKIVEVKGPRDTLSTKQRLWIRFLEALGVDVEVCVVKSTTRKYAA